jgi:hypothetical protein
MSFTFAESTKITVKIHAWARFFNNDRVSYTLAMTTLLNENSRRPRKLAGQKFPKVIQVQYAKDQFVVPSVPTLCWSTRCG